MEGADAKIRRARQHLEQFGVDSTAFLRSRKHNFASKTNETEAWIVYWTDDAIPPTDLSAVIGDCLFNLRSALDNLVCGLIHTQNRQHSCAGRSFPIYTNAEKYAKVRNNEMGGVPEAARKVIDALQPHQRPSGSEALDPLHILNVLCNRDKHRSILLTTAYSKNANIVVHTNDGRVHRVTANRVLRGDGPEIIPLPLRPALVSPSVRIEAAGTGVIVFRDVDGPWGERTVGEILTLCLTHVAERVVPVLRPFFNT